MPFTLDISFVTQAEAALGTVLPASYRSAMLARNGGDLEAADDDWVLYPIADTSDRKRLARTCNNIVTETRSCCEWHNFPTGAVAIAGNGTGDQLIFLKGSDGLEAIVYCWRHETGGLESIATDFSELCAS